MSDTHVLEVNHADRVAAVQVLAKRRMRSIKDSLGNSPVPKSTYSFISHACCWQCPYIQVLWKVLQYLIKRDTFRIRYYLKWTVQLTKRLWKLRQDLHTFVTQGLIIHVLLCVILEDSSLMSHGATFDYRYHIGADKKKRHMLGNCSVLCFSYHIDILWMSKRL